MTTTRRAAPLTRLTTLVALGFTLAACTRADGGDEYVKDGDSGAASPATVITPDNPGGPDSTTGLSAQRAGTPGVAGTRQTTAGDSGIRSTSPASTTPGTGNQTPKRP